MHRAGDPDHPVRAEISRRHDVARPGDAGGVRLHHRAGGVLLAGRQLSAAGRLERVGAPHRLADGVARCAGEGRDRRGLQPHQAQRDHRRGDEADRPVGRRSTTAPRWSTTPKSSSRRASACWSPAKAAPARARWCAPSPACGLGAAARSQIQHDSRLFLLPQRPYVPTGTLRRAAAYPGAAEDWDAGADRGGAGQGRARSSQGPARGRGAVGPDTCPAAKSSG